MRRKLLRKPVCVTLLNGIRMDLRTYEMQPGEEVRCVLTWIQNDRNIDGRLEEREHSIPFFLRLEP